MDSNGDGFVTGGDPRDLMWNPRPLSEPDAAVLRAAAAPLLRDLAAAGKPVPEIRAEAWEDRDEAVCGWIAEPGGSGMGIWVSRDLPPAGQVAELAPQFQDWADEELDGAGRSSPWPLCPEHGPYHQLEPDLRDGAAVWVCPRDGRAIAPIGALPAS